MAPRVGMIVPIGCALASYALVNYVLVCYDLDRIGGGVSRNVMVPRTPTAGATPY